MALPSAALLRRLPRGRHDEVELAVGRARLVVDLVDHDGAVAALADEAEAVVLAGEGGAAVADHDDLGSVLQWP